MAADLTGEVEIHFKSDVIPLERFIDRRRRPTPSGQHPGARRPTSRPWGDSAGHPGADDATAQPRRPGRSARCRPLAPRRRRRPWPRRSPPPAARRHPAAPAPRPRRPARTHPRPPLPPPPAPARPPPRPAPPAGGAARRRPPAPPAPATRSRPAPPLRPPPPTAPPPLGRSGGAGPAAMTRRRRPRGRARAPALAPRTFATPPDPAGVQVTPAVENLVAPQVQALLRSSPRVLPALRRPAPGDGAGPHARSRRTARPCSRTGSARPSGWARPRCCTSARSRRPPAEPASGPAAWVRAPRRRTAFDPAGGQPGRAASPRTPSTPSTSRSFVADLIRGTFNAIVTSSIQQMEAYGELLANVAKTVDQFMADNITDNQARDYLAAKYPGHIVVDTDGRRAAGARLREGADELPKPDLRTDLGVDRRRRARRRHHRGGAGAGRPPPARAEPPPAALDHGADGHQPHRGDQRPGAGQARLPHRRLGHRSGRDAPASSTCKHDTSARGRLVRLRAARASTSVAYVQHRQAGEPATRSTSTST